MRRSIRDQGKDIARLALKMGLLFLSNAKTRDEVGGRIKHHMDDVSDTVSRGYQEAADRLEAASDALRGRRYWPSYMANFVAGLGMGVGLGLLFAPAAGADTRQQIAGKVRDVKDRVVRSSSRESERGFSYGEPATGTQGD